MATILDTIADYARQRVQADLKAVPFEDMQALALEAARGQKSAFYPALSKPALSFICEVKKASPSKGIIAEDFPYQQIAADYEAAGAEAISCLTEPKWFLGSDRIFTDIRAKIKTPMLRKDFVVDPYQIYQAKVMGADAVLLICALHDTAAIHRFLGICDELKLDALVETHDEAEIESALAAGARILGVNNRNLKDFSVDFSNAARLREKIPPEVLYVAESGVKTAEDTALLRSVGADAVLIGETLMRAENKKQKLAELRGTTL